MTAARVEALAGAQLGVLTRAQCLGLGMTQAAIRWMLESGRWQRIHLGVYATHLGPLDWLGQVSAALLCCGDGAVASHGTAARLHGLMDRDPDGIDVLIPASRRVIRPGPIVARPTVNSARPGSTATRPVLVSVATCADIASRTAPSGWPSRITVEDTVLDLAHLGDADNAIAWVSKACQRRRTTTSRIARTLERRTRHRWRDLLVDVLSDVADGVESLLEFRYVHHVEQPHGLPRARRQKVVVTGGRRRRNDNEYEPFGVVVELDGRLGHEGEGAFRDRTRDNIATVSGKVSLRFGWADVDSRPCEVAEDVAAVLRLRGWGGRLTGCGAGCRVRLAIR